MPSKTASTNSSLRPGVEEWQICVETAAGRTQLEPLRQDLSEVNTELCVLPAEVMTVYPLWLRCTDDSLLQGALKLQLEKRNLIAENNDAQILAHRVIAREQNRVLLLCMVLSLEKFNSLNLEDHRAAKFSLSPLSFELPENAMVVWRELGKNVVAFTRNGELAYFQTLLSVDDRSLALELSCLAMKLESESVTLPLEEVVFANPKVDPHRLVADALEKQLALRAQNVADLPSKIEIPSVALLPPGEAQRRQQSHKSKRLKKTLLMMTALYLLLLLALGARMLWTQQIVEASLTRQEFLAAKVADVRQTKQRWQQIQQAVDPDEYPLEILALCVEAIPAKGLQLTDVAINSAGKITLAGQAESIPLALQFKSKLTSQLNLSRYDWVFPQPHTRKKGPGAIFKATGTRNDYVTN